MASNDKDTMPTTYDTNPEPSMLEALKRLTSDGGPHIRLSQVTITVVSAMGEVDDETGVAEAAFVSKGQELLWKRDINGTKYRAQGVADVTIYIDSTKWAKLGTAAQTASMDKALATVKLVLKNGSLVRDDQARPKLTTRHPDKLIEIFSDVVDRNGVDSEDIREIQDIVATRGQLFLPGMIAKPAANARPEEDQAPKLLN